MRLTLIIFIINFLDIDGLKFLVYNPRIGRSHVIHMGKIADVLAKAGHEVINYQAKHTMSYNDTGVKFARTIQWSPKSENLIDFFDLQEEAWKRVSFWVLVNRMNVAEKIKNSCEDQLQDSKLMDILRNEHFDFALTSFMDLCSFLIFKKLEIKRYAVVIPSTLAHFMSSSILGLPTSVSFVPDMPMDASPPLSFFQRSKNLFITQLVAILMKRRFVDPYTPLGQKHVDSNFEIMKSAQETQLVFVNSDPFVDFPRPISHKIHYIGGIGMKKPEPLNDKFSRLFEEGDNFIYMSFGTIASSYKMPNETKAAFLEAFSRFPHIRFLWKYEKPEERINANHPNVIIERWWPQTNLLVHPKMRAFITHGGMNSVSEASQAGIPLITIPLFGDQHRNAKMAEFRGFGIVLNSLELTSDSISNAIQQIVENRSYKQKAHELAALIKDKPYNSEEIFVKYCEFGARFDLNSRLSLSGCELDIFTYYNLDIFALAIFVAVVLILLVFITLRFVVRKIYQKLSGGKVKTQ